MLRLTGVKNKDEYAGEVRKKQAEQRAQKKEQVARDKAAGTHEAKQAQREANTLVQRNAERKFIETVAKTAGWEQEALRFPEEKAGSLSAQARQRAEVKHHTTLLQRALQVADLQQKSLAIAADERLAEVGGETPEPDASRGLGYSTDYTGRTKDQAADIAAEAGAVDAARRTEDEQKQVAGAKERAAAIKAELAATDVAPAPIKAKILEADKQLSVLKARKALRDVQKQVRAAQKSVDRGEEKAYVIEVGHEPTDDEVQKDVENDLRTMRTRAFLSEVGRVPGGEDSLGRHIGVGAYNALNGVAMAVSGSSVVDRDAVDVLGISGSAHALAMRMRADMPPEDYARAVEALERYHVDHYMARSEAALSEAAGLHDLLKELSLPAAENGDELATSYELNQRRREAIGETQRMLGQALGEMEANAALLVAMKDKRDKAEPISMGKLKTEDAVRRLRAIGLQRGDYTLDHAGASVIASVTPDGLKRIAQPLDYENAAAMRESLAIMNGERDTPDYWPLGIARRPDLAVDKPEPAVTAALSREFTPGPDLGGSMRDYIGGRMADGHAISDIVKDLQSEDMARMAGERRSDYFKALDEVVPLTQEGKPIEAEARRPNFERMADEYVKREFGGSFAPIHAQTFPVDEKAADALHRAFSAHPAGPLAFKAVGDLEATEQGALRDYFDKNVAPPDKESAGLRKELAALDAAQPEAEVDDMFGRGTNPEHTAWKQQRAELQRKLDETGLSWKKYQAFMGGTEAAYRAVQDHLRGRVVRAFHDVHSKLNPDQPLKLGRTVVSNHLRHIEAVDPASREKRLAETRALIDSLRDRGTGGQYAAGSVAEKMDAARERKAAAEQAQLGMFAAAPTAETPGQAERELAADERYTLGAAAEARLSQMAPKIGAQFKPGQPVKIWQPGMTGKFAAQQRAMRLIEHNKRVALAQGTGSGKTSMGIGGFTNLKGKGKVKRGLFVVPSIVQGQFNTESLNLLEPGKFRWHAEPGASREDRLKAYADPGTDFSVVTHQSFRDDLVHLGAQHAGVTEQDMAQRLEAMDADGRRAWARATMAKHGMDHDYLMVDEGHNLLNRAGKENSAMANVLDAVSSNTPYYVNATADPIKNDSSEIFDVLSKMDPKRYSDRASFMRRYGVDTLASRDALRRELARYFYPGHIKPDVQVHAQEHKVDLTDEQRQALRGVDENVAALRMSRLSGAPDVAAARALSPDSFEGAQPSEHDAIAKRLAESVGVLRQSAYSKVIDAHPNGAKLDAIAKLAKDRRGKPGVVFARNLDTVEHLAERLRKDGHRVVTITGQDSSKAKYQKKVQFSPDHGDAQADILVLSDAGAAGLNAQRGAWLVQNDTPMTAMLHAQRNGRIHRLGQKNPDIELIDMVADHDQEREARARLKQKYGLREMMTTPLERLDDTGFAAYLHRAARIQAAAGDVQ